MRWVTVVVGFVLGVSLLAGCDNDNPTHVDPDFSPPDPYARTLTHPDSLLKNLQASYEYREIDRYADLLGPDFKFVFAMDDITPDIPLGYWNSEEDSTGTRKLFESVQVNAIRVALTWEAPVDATLNGETAQKVVATVVDLDVDQSNGITLRVVGDTEVFYFRAGKPEYGEDASRLYLVQWEDWGHSGGAAKERSGGAAVATATWGAIKKGLE